MKTISVRRFGGGRFAEECCIEMNYREYPGSPIDIETESAISRVILGDLDKPFRKEAHSCIACQYIMRGDPPACNALKIPPSDLYKENDCSDFEAHPIDA